MGVSYGGYNCIDPVSLRDQLVAANLPVDWYGKPNSYECPSGVDSGEGWILLPRSTLDALDLDSLHSLTVASLEGSGDVAAQVQAKEIGRAHV